ncbi:MAG: hypothetical protein F4003_07035 [Acidimicrobiaceae bacterium]|nr:hypothetical protein [Acidimicrobiaceae bacterium]MXW61521.1 hypothetical protein [Acidimicrobiaceae bacterium]MYC42165.1 hypothetical protein [Acidimicrobiaceae bacterium]MYH88991.1 hypothetical protein [Acidimicrobiaceae bacterium]
MSNPHWLKRGTNKLDPARPARSFTQIADEVLTHVLGHADTELVIRVDIEAKSGTDLSLT